jgi:hypothetical protein
MESKLEIRLECLKESKKEYNWVNSMDSSREYQLVKMWG